MDDPGTDALRKLAPNWTLAGDEQLLSILQNTHQKLLSKCQEANSQLEQMATALNDASISLQNVNNKFMALSSSQFIESRVYDDDDLATDVQAAKEQPKPEVPDELTSLKRSISVLENTHEIITILQDSDTESDTDDEMPARMVLKPKDMYASRPLPYIIGSQPWKNKWHAGLLLEDSDSDSTASKVEHESDQYSQSEPEDTHTDKLQVPHTHTTVSETSSELPSDQGSVPKPTPSDVASEIARRLGGREPPKMVERDPEDEEPSRPTVRKIYRPQDPISSTIFPDEPPPLSDQSDSQDSDIFADLHRSQPYARTHAADDLFSNEKDSDDGDIFSDFAKKPATDPSAKPTSLFDAGPAPNMFVKHTDNHHKLDNHSSNHRRSIYDDDIRRHGYDENDDSGDVYNDGDRVYDQQRKPDVNTRGDEETDRGVKKPVGGISLFGNKGTESIGAAILKRNQRKSSSSGDDSESDSRSESQSNQIRKEKDIFDDLFARSEAKKVTKDKVDFSKDLKTEIKKKVEVKDKKIEKPKVDLFSDNLFDDIDDIFTTNVVKMPAKDNAKSKSIFEDDDDLFSEIAAPKPMKIEVASSSNNNKSLFDSDDELFSENIAQDKSNSKPKETAKPIKISKPKVAEKPKVNEDSKVSKEQTKSIFDDDEDELFGDAKTINKVAKVQNNPVSIKTPNDLDINVSKYIAPAKTSSAFKSPSLFDDDDDDNDLFAEPTKSNILVKAATIKDTKLSNKTEVNIPEEIIDVKPSSSVNTDEIEQIVVKNENVDVNKDSNKPIIDTISNTSETSLKEEKDSSIVHVSESVVSKEPISIKNVETNAAKIFDHIHKPMEQSSSDTNNEFSDQDFDDLPPKEVKITPMTTNSPIYTETNIISSEKHNIFDKTTLEEDIDELFVTAQQNTENTETLFKNLEPHFTETILKKTEEDNKTAEKAPKLIESDIFSNIITEPPAFEKPKEPKKSKNVNALFDDDSDDESLFFKKNDPIFVENPEDFTPTQDRIFGLFTDEPPDDGFGNSGDEFDDDMFSTLPKPKAPQHEFLPPVPNDMPYEDSASDYKNPVLEKIGQSEEISSNSQKNENKPVVEITKESNLDIEEDIFKLPTTDKKQKSSTVLSDTENISINKSKPPIKEKPSLDLLSDDENLFTSGTKLEKPSSAFPEPKKSLPESILTSKDKPSPDPLSDDENLFTSVTKLEKPPSTILPEAEKPVPKSALTSKEKLSPDTFSDDENLFTAGPKLEKPTSLNSPKPSLDLLSDEDENLFTSASKLDNPLDTTKSEKSVPVNKIKSSEDENIFNSVSQLERPTSLKPVTPVTENKNLEPDNKSSDDELFTSLQKTAQDSKSDEDLFKIPVSKPEFIPKPLESKPDQKKVGKLKVGLNINVNALLPGASPKKVKPNDQPDGQSQSAVGSQKPETKNLTEVQKSEPEKPENQNTDSKLLKSVSFDGEPESDILDNKLSKERAKIQVKRRPSTRRARREAVRKSGIDFGEDSTDNSSSIDDPPRKPEVIKKANIETIKTNENKQAESIDKPEVATKVDDTLQAEINPMTVEKQSKIEPTPTDTQAEIPDKPSFSKDVKSKLVYILNDEDIFNTSPVEKPETLNKNTVENLESNIGVTTLGKVYDKAVESSSKKDLKSSLFGDEKDEEIFKAKTAVKKTSIFDSDSEEDLFGTSKKEERRVEQVEVKREMKREVVKGSLFGDEDDDDDLFGVKTRKVVDQKPQLSRSTAKETPKPAEPVFEDPLSMFGDDD